MLISNLFLWLGIKLSMPPMYFIILGVAWFWKLMDD